MITMQQEAAADYVQQEDLENIISYFRKDFLELENATFLITGATGLIGSQLVKTLLCCNRLLGKKFKIIGIVRNAEKAKQLYAHLLCREELELNMCDLANPVSIHEDIDYIIHAASITASKAMITAPVDVIRTSVLGTDHILQLAKEKRCKSIVYLSSMEVYGYPPVHVVTENDLGYLDLNNPRSCYPESKRLCEALCKAYSVQFGLNVKSARLAQTFGPGILQSDRRVFVQFAESVINQTDIVLHTKGTSEGNYCYLRDTIKGIFTLLFYGHPGEFYNVSNESNHMTIAQMAHMVAKEIAKDSIQVVYEIPDDLQSMGYAPETKLKLDTTKLRSLGWSPEVSLKDMYIRMIESMKS